MLRIEEDAMQQMVRMLGAKFPKRESSISVGREKGFRLLIEMKALKQAEDRHSSVPCHWCGEYGEREYDDKGNLCCRCLTCHSLVPVKPEALRMWKLDREWLVGRMKACLGLMSERTVEVAEGITLLGRHGNMGIFLVDNLLAVAMNSGLLSMMREYGPEVVALAGKTSCRAGAAPEGVHVVHIESMFYIEDGKLKVSEPYFATTRMCSVPHAVNGPFSKTFKRYYFPDGSSLDFTDDQAFFFGKLWEAGGDWRKAAEIMPNYEEGSSKPAELFKVGKQDAGYEVRKRRHDLYSELVETSRSDGYRLK